MIIGGDFEKIEFNLFGLELLEPMAFIGDTIIFFISLFILIKINKVPQKSPFFIKWKWFFIIYGLGFFIGGLGHVFYNYTGLFGKYPSWLAGIFTVFFAESAMISLLKNGKLKTLFSKISKAKLLIVVIIELIVFMTVDLEKDIFAGLKVPTYNTLVGFVFSFSYLGYKFSKEISPVFKYLWISVLMMIPVGVIQTLKLSFHPWFDRNDFSHVLLIISMLMYYQAIKGYSKHLTTNA